MKKPSVLISFVLLHVVFLILLIAVRAFAVPLTFNYSGTVDYVDPRLESVFSLGDMFSYTFTFESEAPSTIGIVEAAHAKVGSYVATSPDGNMSVLNYVGYDQYNVSAVPATGADIGDLYLNSFNLSMTDFTGSAFSHWQLPLTPPDPSLFDAPSGDVLGSPNSATLLQLAFLGPSGSKVNCIE